MTDVLYKDLKPDAFRKRLREAPIAYLPLGTFEWHGEHMPLGSDGIQSEGFFKQLAEEAGGIVLPMLFLGPDAMKKDKDKELYGMDFHAFNPDGKSTGEEKQLDGSAYWVPDEFFDTLLDHIFKQLKRAGFKVIVAHGHGPSTAYFTETIPKWEKKYGLKCFNCWGSEDDKEGMGLMVDHAAMNETSLVMALRPELVDLSKLPQDLDEWPIGIAGKDPRIHANEKMGYDIIKNQLHRMKEILSSALDEIK